MVICSLMLLLGASTVLPRVLPAGEPSAWVTPQISAPNVKFFTFESKAVRGLVSYHVYVPPDYGKHSKQKFPVLYWLHGSGGGLMGIAQVSGFFDAAITKGKMPPVLIVFPNGMANGMWCDSKDGKIPIEKMVVTDFISNVDSKFRTVSSRSGRIIEGFSMGGYGAARFGFKYPHLFAGISMLGAGPLQRDFLDVPAGGSAVSPRNRTKIFQEMYGSDPDYFLSQSPWQLAEKHFSKIKGQLAIRQIIGDKDFTLSANQELHSHLKQLGIPHEFVTAPDIGHDAMALLRSLGEANWKFYRTVLESPDEKK